WPVRTGILVENGTGYCAGGLFPVTEGVYLAAFDVATGREDWKRKVDLAPQGCLAAAAGKLLVPTGRTPPVAFALEDGQRSGAFTGPGGDFVLIAGDVLVTGPGESGGQLSLAGLRDRKAFATLNGQRLASAKDRAYLLSRTEVAALDFAKFTAAAKRRAPLDAGLKDLAKRTDKDSAEEKARLSKELEELAAETRAAWLWHVKCANSHALIAAGDIVVAGGEGRVNAFRGSDGQAAWSAPVAGHAYGLAVADGRLLVSTDQGAIYCFEPGSAGVSPASGGTADAALAPVRPKPFSGPSPYPADERAAAILKHAGVGKGFCLVAAESDGRLAYELAKRSELNVIAVISEGDKATAARQMLSAAGSYGARLSIHYVAGDTLPYADGVFNLIVCDAAAAPPPAELFRVLRPWGGTLVSDSVQQSSGLLQPQSGGLRYVVAQRGPLPGAGEWSHGLGDAGNTLCSNDRLVAGQLALQWFGEPGPGEMPDRHHRSVPPLCRDGRLFVAGDEQLLAIDAFNGVELWRQALPGSRRLGVFLDCSNLAVDSQALYVAAQRGCRALDPATGRLQQEFSVPAAVAGEGRAWGYLAVADGLVFGSACKPGARYQAQSYKDDALLWGDRMELVASDALFALNGSDGTPRWTYASGLVLDTTVTVGGGRVCFIETKSPKAVAKTSGRAPMEDVCEGPNELIALDLKTGQPAWRRGVDLANCRHIAYLSYSDGMLVLTGNRYVEKKLWYFFTGIEASTGKTVWERSHNTGYNRGGDHGEQNRHPVIVGGTIYTDPLAYELKTGQPVEGWKYSRHGHGCGGLAASAGALFWRGGNPWRWDLRADAQAAHINTETRPGCWLNMVPACGLLLIPEASSGCTCSFPIQTSLAYRPATGF
ncbi:MAG: PQQ-binding-like beta-propeller repeat protein, partial [Planctomycetota bacterium]